MLPLYKQAADSPPNRAPHGNAGLWFDKFCNTWREEKTWTLAANGHSNPKFEWIKKALEHDRVGVLSEIREAALRLLRLAEARGGRSAIFRTQARFVSGLGKSHPIENGFTWHPTLGVPYLPGSSIKGTVLAWTKDRGINNCDRIFGGPGRVGSVCFLDAIPTEPVCLEADVITPHYAGWDAENPPGDWHSPTPVPFLTTAMHTPFLFVVVPRGHTAPDDAELAMTLLAEALEIVGAGAKTTVGYGRMERDERTMKSLLERRKQQEEELREQQRMSKLTPLERELIELANNHKAQAAYLTWLQELERGRWDDDRASRTQVLDRIKEEMQRSGSWKPTSNAKRPDKDRDHQRTLRIQQLLRTEI
jgi:CRISPR-associated protein Cmr6